MKNNSKLEKIRWEQDLSIEEISSRTGISKPIIISINRGRIKKHHSSTIKILCDFLSTEEKQYTKDDILGLLEAKDPNTINQEKNQ